MIRRHRILALLKALAAVVAWGSSFIATKLALRELSPIAVVWLRFAIGLVVLALVVGARREFALVGRRELGRFAVLGFLGITLHQWLQSNGLVTSMASTTAWIVASTPIFIAVLGWLVLSERVGWIGVAGIVLATLGVLLVVGRGSLAGFTAGRFGRPGDILILASAPNWAVFSVLSRHGLGAHPASRMMLYVMGFGWLFTSVQFLGGPGFGGLVGLSLSGWASIAFLGVVCSGIAYVFWYDALAALPATQVGAVLYLEPLVSVMIAAAVLGESIVVATLVGGTMILLGVWLVNRRPPEDAAGETARDGRGGSTCSPSATTSTSGE